MTTSGINRDAFPGQRAVFTHESGRWVEDTTTQPIVKEMTFRSEIPDSLFTRLSFFGYTDGKIQIAVSYKIENAKSMEGLLQRLGIEVHDENSLKVGTWFFRGEDIKKLYSVLTAYNEIPESHFALIRSLAQTGNWKHLGSL